LTGHGITAKQCEETLAVARKFFDLPEAAKLEVEMIHSPHFRGYTRAGRELTRVVPIGASNSTSTANVCRSGGPALQPGCGCKVPINGRDRCPSFVRRCSAGRPR
jgi:isopenicillin N synthase-like dioxygenase